MPDKVSFPFGEMICTKIVPPPEFILNAELLVSDEVAGGTDVSWTSAFILQFVEGFPETVQLYVFRPIMVE